MAIKPGINHVLPDQVTMIAVNSQHFVKSLRFQQTYNGGPNHAVVAGNIYRVVRVHALARIFYKSAQRSRRPSLYIPGISQGTTEENSVITPD
jgi:hypothetical protein